MSHLFDTLKQHSLSPNMRLIDWAPVMAAGGTPRAVLQLVEDSDLATDDYPTLLTSTQMTTLFPEGAGEPPVDWGNTLAEMICKRSGREGGTTASLFISDADFSALTDAAQRKYAEDRRTFENWVSEWEVLLFGRTPGEHGVLEQMLQTYKSRPELAERLAVAMGTANIDQLIEHANAVRRPLAMHLGSLVDKLLRNLSRVSDEDVKITLRFQRQGASVNLPAALVALLVAGCDDPSCEACNPPGGEE